MENNEPLAQVGGRKFIIAVLVLAFAFGLTIAGDMVVAEFIDLARWIMGLYIVGNVGTKLISK